GGQDEVSESDAGRHTGDRGQLDEGLEDRRVDEWGIQLEVVVQPERLEPERLGLPRRVDRARPRRGAVEAHVFAVTALRERDADLPRDASHGPQAASTRSRTAGTSAAAAIRSAGTECPQA